MNVKARTARLATAVAAVAFVAAACSGAGDADGGDAGTQATSAPVTTAVPPTSATPTTTAASPLTTAAASALPTDAMDLLIAAIENSADRSVRGDMRLDMAEMASVAVEFETDSNRNQSITMRFGEMMGSDGEGPGIEIRFVGGDQFLQFVVSEGMQGFMGEATPEGWFTLDSETAADAGIVCPTPVPGGMPESGVCQLPNDNTFLIEHLNGAEIVGQDDLGGLAVSHVQFAVDAKALVAQTTTSFGDGAGGLLPFGDDFGPDEFIFDIWIDSDGLIRRLSLDLGAAMEELRGDSDETESDSFGDAFASLFDITYVIDYYDYGADITIEAPPADEIVGDFGDMMGAGFSAS